jgi:imidazolonepropionase-like amidohydrolase
MVNAWSNIGLTEIGAVPATNDANEMGDFKPQLLAFSAVHPASEHIPVARVNGITTSLSAPSGGIIAGQAVLLHLDGWTADEMAILKSAGMVLDFPGFGGFSRVGTRQSFSEARRNQEKQVKDLTELLEKARHYAKAREANPATERDRQLDALVPVIKGQMTVFIGADTAREIRGAVEFAKKEKLKFVIQGGREASKVADLLKKENVPVILGLIIALPTREDDPYDARFTVPRDLAKAGVKFALTAPSSSDMRNLPYEAGFAQAYGLPHEEALKTVTLYPAEILGVADRIGSIEKGKIADLVVTDGDLLEIRTQIKNLFIAGKNVSLETKQTRLYQQYLARP